MSVPANDPVAAKPRTRARGAAPASPAPEQATAGGSAVNGPAKGPRGTVGENDVGLDQLLATAANQERHLIPGSEALKLGIALARRPRLVMGRGASLVA